MKHLILSFLIGIGAGSLQAKKTAVMSRSKPNLILILADDLGYADVGFTGSTEIETPVLDRLASQGVIFNNGYVTHAYCGPSRAGLITGRYQARFGVEVNFPFAPFDPHSGLPVEERTFGTRMQKSGYRTAMFGKWHMGAAHPYHPNNRGFDYFYGFLGGAHDYFPENTSATVPLKLNNGKLNHMANAGSYLPLMRNDDAAEFDEYLTTALSRDAAAFIESTEDPFCMYLAYNAPHTPLQAPDALIEKYAHIKDKSRRIYAAMIDSMDQGIGMVIDALEKNGKLDNTLIFFFSDNGGPYPKPGYDEGFADNSPYRAGKGSMLEGGTHVPFIAHWPKQIPAGTTYDFPVSALDVAATFVAVGDGDTTGPELEGVNLIPYARGEKSDAPHEAIFLRMRNGVNWSVRTPTAKLILPRAFDATGEPGEPELYDMINDPYETKNLINERPEQRAELAKLWNQWNADNIANRYMEIGSFQKYRLKMYEELSKKLDKEAAQQKTVYAD
ncbi:MAG: sulfatase family protein [Opitutaceae bacterium]